MIIKPYFEILNPSEEDKTSNRTANMLTTSCWWTEASTYFENEQKAREHTIMVVDEDRLTHIITRIRLLSIMLAAMFSSIMTEGRYLTSEFQIAPTCEILRETYGKLYCLKIRTKMKLGVSVRKLNDILVTYYKHEL